MLMIRRRMMERKERSGEEMKRSEGSEIRASAIDDSQVRCRTRCSDNETARWDMMDAGLNGVNAGYAFSLSAEGSADDVFLMMQVTCEGSQLIERSFPS